MNLPPELTARGRGCSIDMYNDRGSFKLLDIYIEKEEAKSTLFSFDFNASSGHLGIECGERKVDLDAFQVEMLVRFLQQRE